jgi:adenylate cyclase
MRSIEIERKFLVCGDAWHTWRAGAHAPRQSFFPSRPYGMRAYGRGEATLTIEGCSGGASRSEWEYPIPGEDAEVLLDTVCERRLIDKAGTRIRYAGMTWEGDEFFAENSAWWLRKSNC